MRFLPVMATALAGVVGCAAESTPPIVQDESTPTIKTVAFNMENAPTVTFHVPDMVCEFSCAPKVKQTLAESPGVKDVKVDLETKTATVAINEAVFNTEEAIDALVDVQFTNTTLAQ